MEKENQNNYRKSNIRGRNRKIEQGNDYVLKRFQLQENKNFAKDKKCEQLSFEIKKDPTQLQNQPYIQDQLVIIPLQIPQQISCEDKQISCKQQQIDTQEHNVYVFDDDEGEQKSQNGNTKQISTPRINFKAQQRSFQEISLHGTHRDSFSTAQLVSPKQSIFRKQLGIDPKNFIEKICKNQDNEQGNANKQQVQLDGLENIKGVIIETGNGEEQEISISITDKKMFSMAKLPTGIILKCIIKRTNSILNIMSPEFDLYLANGLKHVLSAKKYPFRNRQLFKFSIDPQKFSDSNLLGVLHANVNHSIYWLLDQPRKIGDLDLSFFYSVISYCKLKKDTQRKFTVLLPPTSNTEYQLALDYEMTNINFSQFKEQIKVSLSNIQTWDDQWLNSAKNFVIADEDDQEYRYLQLKKQADNVFQLTIQHPFSPLQAMAIAMTRFDVQLN